MNSKRKRRIESIKNAEDISKKSAKTSKVESSTSCSKSERKRLIKSFYDQDCESLAKALLGKLLVTHCKDSGKKLSGVIVETEAYLGGEDKGAHSFNGKKTAKNEAMFMEPGTCYVYNIYGMYCCINISSEGEGAAVLLRAIDPVDGIDHMQKIRSQKSKTITKEKDLCNGPSKLCQALTISKDRFNKTDLTEADEIWLEDGDVVPETQIVKSARINIDYAEEWAKKPLRFYVLGNKSVSKRDKMAEDKLKD
ncbi:DNA-3-methyladenine glycosylase-like [Saccostrea cucullata]|uniref:DNA-3-methyladenine glycosylase-like n=1 Tax=Saccostrea cuccullata TaxID=36930 RepID=UPI002ED083B0